jgi:hypothetical protein
MMLTLWLRSVMEIGVIGATPGGSGAGSTPAADTVVRSRYVLVASPE